VAFLITHVFYGVYKDLGAYFSDISHVLCYVTLKEIAEIVLLSCVGVDVLVVKL
jgi:hypothetical protein